MTENDAKQKWCPKIEGFQACIASNCMMWRWAESQEEWFHRIEEGKKISGMDTQEAAECLPKLGYCGLAGM